MFEIFALDWLDCTTRVTLKGSMLTNFLGWFLLWKYTNTSWLSMSVYRACPEESMYWSIGVIIYLESRKILVCCFLNVLDAFGYLSPYQNNHFPTIIINSFVWYSLHGENFMAIFTTISVVIWFSTGTLGIFGTLVYVFTIRVVIYDILSMAIITTSLISILFCNLYYILLWISPRSVVKIAIRI